MSVGGRTMLQRCVDGLLASGAVDEVVVVVGANQLERAATLVGPGATVVQGGAERTDSVRAGLAAVDAADWILVHDAARPLTPPDMIARIVAELRTGRGAVIPAVAVTDTIKSIDVHGDVIGTPDRAACAPYRPHRASPPTFSGVRTRPQVISPQMMPRWSSRSVRVFTWWKATGWPSKSPRHST